mmetsp:Transcript_30113/g.65071  ORF Transcript_30113/g.65071 Transcript_30113/m.65071 type:complete len:399 (-) Transcript_30113:609-1805(-)
MWDPDAKIKKFRPSSRACLEVKFAPAPAPEMAVTAALEATDLERGLKRLDLSGFLPALKGVGVKKLDDITVLEDKDLVNLGMDLVQVRRLQRLAHEPDRREEMDALRATRKVLERTLPKTLPASPTGLLAMARSSKCSDHQSSRHWKEQAQGRPLRLVFIRHGESEANVNRAITKVVPDHLLHLTLNGRQQALDAGRRLKEIVGDESIRFVVSPYVRTRETLNGILQSFDKDTEVREDVQIREQEHGNLDSEHMGELHQIAQKFGPFYFRFPDGESPADCYDRASLFLESLYRSWEYNKAKNQVFVSHGMMILVVIMRLMRIPIHDFTDLEILTNAEFVVLEREPLNPKFEYSFTWQDGQERKKGGPRRKDTKVIPTPIWDGSPDAEALVSEPIRPEA